MFRRKSPRGRNRSARFSLQNTFSFRGRAVDRILDHKRGGRRLAVEPLEERRMLAVVTVTNTLDVSNGNVASIADLLADDGGDGVSLREAIQAANNTANNGGPDEIEFNIPGAGVQTIQPASPLPAINDAVIVDGYTQPGASVNTAQINSAINATLLIEIDGQNAGVLANGLTITENDSTIQGLIINRFDGNGIEVILAINNEIQGNFIGTDAAGTGALPNVQRGVLLSGGASSNTIGGLQPSDRNLISGNGIWGIEIFGTGGGAITQANVVQGNFIGVDATGGTALGNGVDGIRIINDARANVIGGLVPSTRNVISGNTTNGVSILDQDSSNNRN